MISLEYAAGFFDGEGCITIVRNKNSNSFALNVGINNTAYLPLKLICDRFGGSVRFRKSVNPNWRPQWQWQAVCKNAYYFLSSILPLLLIKKEEAKLAIEFYEYIQSNKESQPAGCRKKLSDEEIEKRIWYKKTLSDMKRD